MGVLRICFNLRFSHPAVFYNSSIYLCPQMTAASIFPSGRLQAPTSTFDFFVYALCCHPLSSLSQDSRSSFLLSQKVLQQGSVFKIGVCLQSVSKQSKKKMLLHNAFQNKGLFPITLVTSRSYTVCAFPHSLSIAPSEPKPFPSLWLYKVCAGATALQHFGASRGESEAIPVLRERPSLFHKICLAHAPEQVLTSCTTCSCKGP